MRHRRSLALITPVVLSLGCEPGGPSEPESSSVTLSVGNPLGVQTTAPLRYALVWRDRGPRLFATSDGPVDLGQTEARLFMPGTERLGQLAPIEKASLLVSTEESTQASVYRPSLVVYEDSNGSGAFEIDLPAGDGPDRVLAVNRDYVTLGAVLDLEALLEKIPMERIAAFYTASGGRYSPFVALSEYAGSLDFDVWTPEYTLELDDSGYPRETLRCAGTTDSGTVNVQSIILDQGIDPVLCGTNASECTSTALANVAPPAFDSLTSSVLTRISQCHARAPLQALTIVEARTTCADCACTHEIRQTSYVADQSALPSWWPCGTTLPFCDSTQTFVGYSASCGTP